MWGADGGIACGRRACAKTADDRGARLDGGSHDAVAARARGLGGGDARPSGRADPARRRTARWVQIRAKVGRFRAIVTRAGDRVRSRRGADLTTTFPEIAAAAAAQLEPGTVLDGELVIWSAGKLDFEALQLRMGRSARGAADLASRQPASLAVFDVLAAHGQDLRPLPFDDRRARLETLAAGWRPPLNLSPVTDDRDVAQDWFETYAAAGIEGLVINGGAQPYQPGVRARLKVKHRTVVDVVCGAVIGPRSAPQQIIAGLPIEGHQRIVGRTGPLSPAARQALAPWLAPPTGDHPWPPRVPRAAFGSFNTTGEPIELTLVEPVVVEVSADAAWSGRAFRHALRLVRARPELNPVEVSPPSNTA